MTEQHSHHHHHHHDHHDHHHDFDKNNAEYFSEQAASYRTELSLELAKRTAKTILNSYSFDVNQTEVLDFACGPGLIAFELLPFAKKVVGADISTGMVDVFNKTVQEQGIPSEKLQCIKIDPLKNEPTDIGGLYFDVIFCVLAYHHFENPLHITQALANRLKPNGRLFIVDFLDDENLGKLFSERHEGVVAHKHGFSSEQMIEMLKTAGLQNPHFEIALQMPKAELKTYQGHEVFGNAINSDADFTLTEFIAYADK